MLMLTNSTLHILLFPFINVSHLIDDQMYFLSGNLVIIYKIKLNGNIQTKFLSLYLCIHVENNIQHRKVICGFLLAEKISAHSCLQLTHILRYSD